MKLPGGPAGARIEASARGVTLGHDGEAWSATLRATRFGCAGALAAIAGTGVEGAPGGARYAGRAGNAVAIEWFEASARGVEQGFTVDRPACGGPIVVEVALEGLRASEHGDGAGLDLRDARGVTRLRYTDLSARDALGAPLEARMLAGGEVITLTVDARDAVFPVTIDPTAWYPTQQLDPTAALTNSAFGSSLALSGGTAVVGAAGVNHTGSTPMGSAFFYVQGAGGWQQQQEVTASNSNPLVTFGASAAISGDTAIVGSITGSGAFLFARSGTTWTQTQALSTVTGPSSFGAAVGLSAGMALVGAPGFMSSTSPGEAYSYADSGGNWSLQQIISGAEGFAGDAFGAVLAMENTTAVLGAPAIPGPGVPSAYVFTLSGGAWTEQQQLLSGTSATGDDFGTAVALSGDTAVIGAPATTVGSSAAQGVVYVFTRTGTTWALSSQIVASDGQGGDYFGAAVALDGTKLLVGAPGGTSMTKPGKAYVFGATGGSWSQQQELTQSGGPAGAEFGAHVALQSGIALIAAVADPSSAQINTGVVYVEQLLSTPGTPCTSGAQCGGGGYCVDGVCCDSACNQTCEACDVVPGKCSPVSGAVHGNRAKCASSGPVCGGACDGVHVDACRYPAAGTSCGVSCSGNKETDDTCDGKGACVTGTPATCRNNFVCNGTSRCFSSCTSESACVAGYRCAGSSCQPGGTCLNDHTALTVSGETRDCGAYACDPAAGACHTACVTVDDCSDPHVCDPSGVCTAPPDTASALTAGCSVASPGGAGGLTPATGLAALLLLRRRSARSRRERSPAAESR